MTAATHQPAGTAAADAAHKIETHKVGFLFAHEYYTRLNQSPERMHLLYTKKAYLIHGVEGEAVSHCIGPHDIHNKVMELNLKDCKFHVSNIDTVPSHDGSLLIQTIGELAVGDSPSQKFAQTFLLVQTPGGYSVMNDIFRFIKDDDEPMEGEESAPQESVTIAAEPEQQQQPAAVLETPAAPKKPEAPTPAVPEPKAAEPKPQAPVAEAKPTKAPAPVTDAEPMPEQKPTPAWQKASAWGAPTAAAAAVAKPAPAAHEAAASTPAAPEPEAEAKPAAPEPVEPSGPKSWASLAASNPSKWGSHATDAKSTTTAPAPRPAAPVSAPKPDVAAAARPGSGTAPTGFTGRRDRNDEFTVIVKGVKEDISSNDLKAIFKPMGHYKVLDVLHHRGIAYVDFTTPEGFRNALEQPKITIKGHVLTVEEKHKRTGGGFRHSAGGHRRGSPPHGARDFAQSGGYGRRGGGNPGVGRGGKAPGGPRNPPVANK